MPMFVTFERVAAAKNEELAEEWEKKLRINTFIIHESKETNDDSQSVRDEVFSNKLITDLSFGQVTPKTILDTVVKFRHYQWSFGGE